MESRGAVIFMPRDIDGPSLMLEELLFDPAAAWLSAALERGGVDRFLVVCHEGDRAAAEACFPAGTQFVLEGAAGASEQLLAFLEPAMILLMGLIVGTIVMAVVIPLYSLYSQMM